MLKTVMRKVRIKDMKQKNKNEFKTMLNESSITSNIENYISRWREFGDTEKECVSTLFESVSEYIEKCPENKKNSIINELAINVIPEIKGIKSYKPMIMKYTNKSSIIESAIDKEIVYERILNNSKKLSNNKEYVSVLENRDMFLNERYEDIISELCEAVDSFDMSIPGKYIISLENIGYSLDGIVNVDEKTILKEITEYYALKTDSKDDLNKMRELLEDSLIFEESLKDEVKYLFGEEIIYEETSSVDKLIDQFKAEEDKSTTKFNKILNRLYGQSVENIIEETPNLLSVFRKMILFSTFAINGWLGLIVTFVDRFTEMNVKRKQGEKMLKIFQKEKDKTEDKLNRMSDEKSQAYKNRKEYLDTLKKVTDKLEIFNDNLYSEKELAEKDSILDDDIDFNDESAVIIAKGSDILFIESVLSEYQNYRETDIMPIIYEDKEKLSNDDIMALSIIAYENSNIIDPFILTSYLLEMKHDLTNQAFRSTKEYDRLSVLNESISILHDVKNVNYIMESIEEFYNKNEITKAILEFHEGNTEAICEFLIKSKDKKDDKKKEKKKITDIDKKKMEKNKEKIDNLKKSDPKGKVKEVRRDLQTKTDVKIRSFVNTMKVTSERMKKKAQGLSDKEKQVSKQMDNQIYNMRNKMEMELSNKNREAVIKGSIMPSFSTIMKIFLASGALSTFVSPVLGVITAVGSLGVSKVGTLKQKQYILDEIDIQLNLVDKKIQLADSNNDMKAMESLLKTQQQLKREKKRILYNMKSYQLMYNND